jgi:hypothetical protein
MSYIIYIAVGLVALWFIGKLFKPDSRLLRVEIATNDARNYSVNSQNINEECKPIEWVWLNLHLPAKLIYNIGNQTALQLDKKCLMELMYKYSENNWKTSNDVIAIANRYLKEDINMEIGFGEGKKIIATLSFLDLTNRSLYTKLKFLSQFQLQFTHTFVCTMAMAANVINEDQRKHLKKSLSSLYTEYLCIDTSTIETLQLPSTAFADGSPLAIFNNNN